MPRTTEGTPRADASEEEDLPSAVIFGQPQLSAVLLGNDLFASVTMEYAGDVATVEWSVKAEKSGAETVEFQASQFDLGWPRMRNNFHKSVQFSLPAGSCGYRINSGARLSAFLYMIMPFPGLGGGIGHSYGDVFAYKSALNNQAACPPCGQPGDQLEGGPGTTFDVAAIPPSDPVRVALDGPDVQSTPKGVSIRRVVVRRGGADAPTDSAFPTHPSPLTRRGKARETPVDAAACDGGGGGGGSVLVTVCVYYDWYDGNGAYLGTELAGCYAYVE